MALFIPITKVDVAKRLVYGTLSEEVPDKTGEILDYQTAKPAFQEWSGQFHAASNGKSLGNVRAMHGNVAAGKLTDIVFDDARKRIEGVAKIVDDDEWNKVVEGVYTGFSIGGGYARRWPDPENPGLMRYTPALSEVSLVDNPALSTATFDVIKHDGTIECRKFHHLKGTYMSAISTKSVTEKLSSAKSPAYDPELSGDMAEPDIMDLLDDLAWLEECAREEGNAEIVACVTTLQEYLQEEYAMGEEETEGSGVDEDPALSDVAPSSQSYVAELAHSGARQKTTASGTHKMRKTDSGIPADMMRRFAEMASFMETLQKRVVQLEAKPLPPKGVLRAVSKADDRASAQEALAALSPADKARELMKIALANPLEI